MRHSGALLHSICGSRWICHASTVAEACALTEAGGSGIPRQRLSRRSLPLTVQSDLDIPLAQTHELPCSLGNGSSSDGTGSRPSAPRQGQAAPPSAACSSAPSSGPWPLLIRAKPMQQDPRVLPSAFGRLRRGPVVQASPAPHLRPALGWAAAPAAAAARGVATRPSPLCSSQERPGQSTSSSQPGALAPSGPSGHAAAPEGPHPVYNLPNAVSAARLLSGPVIGLWLLQGHYQAAVVALAISGVRRGARAPPRACACSGPMRC
jgi:hypothetical protein